MQILDRMSHQLEHLTFNQGMINSSVPALSFSGHFIPSNSSIWVNVLWFLSLLFSLAAALFGILAKQWLREYLKWNAYLASPRENVLVRQIRFEAWNEWNVEASIACIPALLELALVLFVCGLIVFLWALNPVVAVIFTTVAIVFVCIILYLTLLPAFFKRCPYKSPTAWAFTVIVEFVKTATTYLYVGLWWSLHDASQWRRKHLTKAARNWRKRDIDGADIPTFTDRLGKRHDSLVIVSQAIAEPGRRVSPHHWQLGSSASQTLNAVSQLPILVRALQWAFTASQDKRVDEEIARCTGSMHAESIVANPDRWSLSIWYFLAQSFRVRHYQALPRVWTAMEKMDIVALRDEVRRNYRVVPFGNFSAPKFCWILATRTPSAVLECYTLSDFFVVSHILANSLARAINQLVASEMASRTQRHLAQMAIDMVSALCSIWWANAHRIPADYRPTYATLIADAYNNMCRTPFRNALDESFCGLRCAVLQVIGLISTTIVTNTSSDIEGENRLRILCRVLTFLPVGCLVRVSPYQNTTKNFASHVAFAAQLDPAGKREDKHILATIIDECLEIIRSTTQPLPSSSCTTLLHTMSALLESCLLSSTPNGGYYDEIPWLRTLLSARASSGLSLAQVLHDSAPSAFDDCVSSLERSKRARLVVGDGRVDIGRLVALFPKWPSSSADVSSI